MLIVLVLMMVRLPSHLSTTSRSSSEFNEWISDSMNSKLRFVETQERRNVVAEEDVKLGEVLFDFESSKVITIRNLMRSKDRDLYAQIYEKYEVGNLWMNEIALAAYLCVEYRNPVSDILSYLESLPQRNTDSMSFGLMFYPERALERVLHGSSTLNTLRRVRGYVREIFESVLSQSSLFSKTPLTLGEFEYVFCVSRSHTRK